MSQNVCKSSIISLQTDRQTHRPIHTAHMNSWTFCLCQLYFTFRQAENLSACYERNVTLWPGVVVDVSCGQMCSTGLTSAAAPRWQGTLEWLDSSRESWGLVSRGLRVSKQDGRTVALDWIEPPRGVALEPVFPDKAAASEKGGTWLEKHPTLTPGALLTRSCRRQRGW